MNSTQSPLEKPPGDSPYFLSCLDQGFDFVKQSRNVMNLTHLKKRSKRYSLTVNSGEVMGYPCHHTTEIIWVFAVVNTLLDFPKRKQWGPFFFCSTLFQFQNNRPIARTRMKGRLLPNLEVHRSLQAPKSGCSRNPETEQASGHCGGPHGTSGRALRQPRHIPETPSLKCPQKKKMMKLRVSNKTQS